MHFYFCLIKPVTFKVLVSAKFTMLAFRVLLVLFVRSTSQFGFIFLLPGEMSVCWMQIWAGNSSHCVCLIEDNSFKNSILPYILPLSISGLLVAVTNSWFQCVLGVYHCCGTPVLHTSLVVGIHGAAPLGGWGPRSICLCLQAGVCLPNSKAHITSLLGVFSSGWLRMNYYMWHLVIGFWLMWVLARSLLLFLL